MSDELVPTTPSPLDAPIQEDTLKKIRGALAGTDGKAALILVGDTQTKTMRGQFAARLGSGWEFAAGGGFDFKTNQPFAEFAVVKVWK